MKNNFISIILLLIFLAFSAFASNWRDAAGLDKKKGRKSITVKTAEVSANKSVFIYSVPDAQIERTADSKSVLILGNAVQQSNEGMPTLPVIPVKFIIPAGHTIDNITVVGRKKTRVAGAHTIKHGNALYPLLPDVKVKPVAPKASIYESDNEYPKKRYTLVTVQKKHGVSIAILTLNPAVYKPHSKHLSYFKELQLEITTTPEKRSSIKKGSCFPLRLNLETSGVENSDALSSYTTSSDTPAALGLCNPLESYDWIVITSEEIRDATTDYTINDLVAHRQTMGITTNLITIESILNEYSGIDGAEKLRNFIIDAYTNWNTQYVLLGGDINIIPMRTIYVDNDDEIPSDLYYQCLDGPYNYDGDSYWGEPNDGENGGDVDLMAEVFIGRASAENATEMSHFVYKTLKYETDPEAAPYLHTALMCGEHLGFGGVSEYAKESMEEIRLGADTHGYSTVGFVSSPSIAVNTLYEKEVSWSKNDIVEHFNSNEYSIINHLGHANTNYVMMFYNDDADALSNTNPVFVYSQGCLPGNFESDCVAEHLTTSNRSGCYGGVLNSRYGYGKYESTDGPSQRFDRQFWDAYFEEYMFNVGQLNADSHEDNLWDINGGRIRWCYVETNLFCDPRTRMRGMVIGPMVSYQSHTVTDETGNNNDIAEPGEQLQIPVTLVNNGSDDATGVTATISSSDSYVSIAENSVPYGNIACCGTAASSSDNFVVTIAQNCPTPHTVDFSLTINDGGTQWVSTFSILVNSVSTVSGTVRSHTGAHPVSDATVKFIGPMSGNVTTDAEGLYTISIIDGSYSLQAESEEFLPSDPVTVTTPPGSNVNFSLYRPAIAVSPSSINETSVPGEMHTVNLHITNSGDTDLEFNLTTLDEAATHIVMPVEFYDASHFAEQPKDAIDTRIGTPVDLGSGGPDLFGYRWKDSDEPGGPEYVWNDISSSGTLLSSVSGCDDCYQSQALSFAFPFYGAEFNSIYVGSNGYITLGSGYSQYNNYPIPSTSAPANLIAGFWDDLRPGGGGSVYFQDFGDHAVVQFTNVARYSGSGTYTFQMVLYESGAITFYYNNITGTLTTSTVGIQNATQDDGLQVVYNAEYLQNGFAVKIASAPDWFSVAPESGICAPGESRTVVVTLDATELPEGVKNGQLLIEHNDPVAVDQFPLPVTLTVSSGVTPPAIVRQPENTSVPEGATAQFSVTATGTQPLVYQWKNNGITITGATSAMYTTDPVTLADDATEFTCEVSNIAGKVTSDPAHLTVLAVAPQITAHPQDIAVQEGESAQFAVTASGVNLLYQWQKSGVNIPDASESVYTLPTTTMEDNGAQFACIVSNLSGSVTSNAATLTVIENNNYQLTLISIGASGKASVNNESYTAEDVVIGSNVNGVVSGTRFKLFLK